MQPWRYCSATLSATFSIRVSGAFPCCTVFAPVTLAAIVPTCRAALRLARLTSSALEPGVLPGFFCLEHLTPPITAFHCLAVQAYCLRRYGLS